MSAVPFNPPGFWRVVWLLLAASRRRALGRVAQQRAMMRQRVARASMDWAGLGFFVAVIAMLVTNVAGAYLVINSVSAGERLEAERKGMVVVDRWFLESVRYAERQTMNALDRDREIDRILTPKYRSEGHYRAREYGGDEDAIAARLRQAVASHRTGDFIEEGKAVGGLKSLRGAHSLAALLGSIALACWGVMLVFQGEGIELDTLRRRHPMWEWLFSHPVRPAPVFLAEMLSPMAANPIYYSAPVLPGILYGSVYGAAYGVIAALIVGVPITCAAACLGKALEIGIVLRFPPRSRGAIFGMLGWLGYCSLFLLFFGVFFVDRVASALASILERLTVIPWPWLGVFLGQTAEGLFSFPLGVAACWGAAAIAIAGSVAFSVWGVQRGLSGPFAFTEPVRDATPRQATRFGKDPVYRKELLWFARDRSALVQALLVPLTLAGIQLFNWRNLVAQTQSSWNIFCGAAVLFGTYLFSVLGPRSLASEGNALWIALTWPRGLESLLKAKARLWTLLSSAIVALVCCYAVYLFPASWWKIALVAVAWVPFARSMAEKAVTLATVISESGEARQLSIGRRWAVQLGMLTFSIGVLTAQWALAVTGIVYSIVTAAAMWQNFRARLPYLYDPWSETLPRPPTLMHAMIAISIMVESTAVVSGMAALAGPQWMAIARSLMYAVIAAIVSLAVAMFLHGRGISTAEIWHWRDTERNSDQSRHGWTLRAASGNLCPLRSILAGIALGLLLGLFGQTYIAVLHHFPSAAEILDRSEAQLAAIPHLRFSLLVMAVLIAPIAEEYLFRGLLYRALDREWGGWRAAAGSAAFFAVYHPFLAWLPVGILGFVNAVLFKKTGRLAPAVAVHMIYNFIVLL